MLELLGGGILGGVFGGIFRLAPEVLKFFDKKNEREHELKMFSRQCELEQLRGQQKLAEIGAQRDAAVDVGVMDAFNAAIQQQSEMVKAAGGKVAALSASVRPVMTYYLLVMYGAVKACFVILAYQNNVPFAEALIKNWTSDDMALLTGVVNYWMIDRSLAKRGL
jgi:hypothetical protein